MVKNKTCLCCSTKFSYCPDCSKTDALKPSWAGTFCSEDCMIIWTTATKYNLNKITKSEAKSIIESLTLKPTEQYSKCVQRDLGTILAEEPKSRRGKRAELPVIDDAISDTVTVTVNAEIKDVTEDGVIVELEPVLKNESHVVVLEENE